MYIDEKFSEPTRAVEKKNKENPNTIPSWERGILSLWPKFKDLKRTSYKFKSFFFENRNFSIAYLVQCCMLHVLLFWSYKFYFLMDTVCLKGNMNAKIDNISHFVFYAKNFLGTWTILNNAWDRLLEIIKTY
jgi:hypothetical protein